MYWCLLVNIYAALLTVMNGSQRNAMNAQIWGSKTTRIMMSSVHHITSGSHLTFVVQSVHAVQ